MPGPFRCIIILVLLSITATAHAQSAREDPVEATGSISGRITIGGKAAPGARILLLKRGAGYQEEYLASSRADADGQYQLSELPPGYYKVVPLAPAYVGSDHIVDELSGKDVALKQGESVEGIDFSLIRGSVITGRITTADGQPVTGEHITVIKLDPKGEKQPLSIYFSHYLSQGDQSTDDRGIYRIYGLPPGRYLVSVGNDPEPSGNLLGKSRFFRRLYYPGVSDVSNADIIDLKSGAEATGIDISFGQMQKTYSASGRVVDARTGKPVPNLQLGFTSVKTYNETEDSGFASSFSSSLSTDAGGAFRIEGLMPGTFYVTSIHIEESEFYGDNVTFEVRDQDVIGLLVKVHRGSSISGTLAVEGTDDPGIIARLSRMRIGVSIAAPEVSQRWHRIYRSAAVNPNGSFHVRGIMPGKAQMQLDAGPDARDFSMLRVERRGVDLTQEVDIGPDENIADLRVIIGYGSGRIRGRVNIEGGKLPLDAVINVIAWGKAGTHGGSYSEGNVTPDGRFVIENLMTGEYEIIVRVYTREGDQQRHLAPQVNKKISVTNGAEIEVTFVIDLSARKNNQN